MLQSQSDIAYCPSLEKIAILMKLEKKLKIYSIVFNRIKYLFMLALW